MMYVCKNGEVYTTSHINFDTEGYISFYYKEVKYNIHMYDIKSIGLSDLRA